MTLVAAAAFSTASCWKLVRSVLLESPPGSTPSSCSARRACRAAITRVLPVPGGPCTSAMSGVFRAMSSASLWRSLGFGNTSRTAFVTGFRRRPRRSRTGCPSSIIPS